MKTLVNKVLFTTSNEEIIKQYLRPGANWAYAYAISNMDKVSKELRDMAVAAVKG